MRQADLVAVPWLESHAPCLEGQVILPQGTDRLILKIDGKSAPCSENLWSFRTGSSEPGIKRLGEKLRQTHTHMRTDTRRLAESHS